VVQMLGQLAANGRLPYKKALSVLDGDKDKGETCLALPGDEAPERIVFGDLKANNYSGLNERFGIGAGDLFTFLDDAQLDPDHHTWCASVGNKVLRSSSSVWELLCNQWCELDYREDQRKELVNAFIDSLSS
jgi:hypothetical protein